MREQGVAEVRARMEPKRFDGLPAKLDVSKICADMQRLCDFYEFIRLVT